MDADVVIAAVKTNETRNGNTRWTVTDDNGTEYTTFRPPIGQAAEKAQGSRARIAFHEEERNGFRNVYLDKVEPLDEPAATGGETDHDAEEVAWKTAIEAAPWLLGKAPASGVEADELFEKLQPFKELVAEDIRDGDGDEDEEERD